MNSENNEMQNKPRFLVYQWGACERNLRTCTLQDLFTMTWTWLINLIIFSVCNMYVLLSAASIVESSTTVGPFVLQNVYKRKQCTLIPTAPTRLIQSWASQPTDNGQSCLTLQAAFLVDVTAASWMQMRSQESSEDTQTTHLEKYVIDHDWSIPSATAPKTYIHCPHCSSQ